MGGSGHYGESEAAPSRQTARPDNLDDVERAGSLLIGAKADVNEEDA